MQKYERGVNRIAASRLFDIAQALDMPVARLFDGLTGGRSDRAPATAKSSIEEALATAEGAELMALFAAIKSAMGRRRVVDVVRAIATEQRSD